MLEVVPARVVRRIAEAEIGPQVDDGLAATEELVDPARHGPVGERQEHGLRVVRDVVVDVQVTRREVRVDPGDRIALPLPSDEPGDPDVRVEGEEPDQLRADVARRADDRDPDRIAEKRPHAGRRGGAGRGCLVMTVRRDRRLRRIRAHGRAGPLAGGRIEGSEIGRSVVTA